MHDIQSERTMDVGFTFRKQTPQLLIPIRVINIARHHEISIGYSSFTLTWQRIDIADSFMNGSIVIAVTTH